MHVASLVSMTTAGVHRNSSNEQPISLDHGALLHAADPSGEPVDSTWA